MEEREVNITEAAKLVGANRETIRRHIDAGTLPARRTWRMYMIRVSDLDEWRKEYGERLRGKGEN